MKRRDIPKSNQAAAYIERMAKELRNVARSHNQDFLAYLLEMARLEAAACSMHKPHDQVSSDDV